MGLSVTLNFNPVDFLRILKGFRDQAEVDLNSKRERVPNEPGIQCRLNESLEKRVFEEIFKDQPNALVTQSKPIRFRSRSLPEDVPEEIRDLWDVLSKSHANNEDSKD